MVEVERSISDGVEELLIASYITQRRIYDTLAAILKVIDPESANGLVKLHEQGIFITPPPAMVINEGDEDALAT